MMGLPVRVMVTSEIERRACCCRTVRAISFCADRTPAAAGRDGMAATGEATEGRGVESVSEERGRACQLVN